MSTYPLASLLESLLAERCAHTWEDSVDSEPGWTAKGNPEESPIKVIQTTTRAWLSQPAHVSVHTHCFSLLINTLLVSLLSVSMLEFIYTQLTARALSLATGLWWSTSWDSVLSLLWPGFNLWPEPRPCFKLLWAEATRDHFLSPRGQVQPLCAPLYFPAACASFDPACSHNALISWPLGS